MAKPRDKCSACGASVTWEMTGNGFWQILDEKGPHWATCPDADKFRRRGKKGQLGLFNQIADVSKLPG